jgi:hypothetical protein
VPPTAFFSVTLWNVANLGGGFGYPARRANEVIAAIAIILHAAHSDVCVILEVMERSLTPKPPARQKYELGHLTWRNYPINREQFEKLIKDFDRAAYFAAHPDAAMLRDLGIFYFWEEYNSDGGERRQARKALKEIKKETEDEFCEFSLKRHPLLLSIKQQFMQRFLTYCKFLDSATEEKIAQRWAAYEQRLLELAETAKHSGVQELWRICDDMNQLAEEDRYACWPSKHTNLKQIYKAGETYGFIYRKDRCALFGVTFPDAKTFWKRAPAMAEFRIPIGNNDAATVFLLAYHAPSDSDKNELARTADFEALCNLCKKYRQPFTILASDLNINTLDQEDAKIANCGLDDTISAYFDRLTGKTDFLSTTLFHGGQTTFRATLIQPSLLMALNGMAKRYELPPHVVNLVEEFTRRTRFEERYNAFDKLAIVGGHGLILSVSERVLPLLQALALPPELRLFRRFPGDSYWLFLVAAHPSDLIMHMRALVPAMLPAMRAYGKTDQFSEANETGLMLQLLQLARLMSDHVPITARYVFGVPLSSGLPRFGDSGDSSDEDEDDDEDEDAGPKKRFRDGPPVPKDVAEFLQQQNAAASIPIFNAELVRTGLREGSATPDLNNCMLHTFLQLRDGEDAPHSVEDFRNLRALLQIPPNGMVDADERIFDGFLQAGLHVRLYSLNPDGTLHPSGELGAEAEEDGSNIRYVLHYGAHYVPLWS